MKMAEKSADGALRLKKIISQMKDEDERLLARWEDEEIPEKGWYVRKLPGKGVGHLRVYHDGRQLPRIRALEFSASADQLFPVLKLEVAILDEDQLKIEGFDEEMITDQDIEMFGKLLDIAMRDADLRIVSKDGSSPSEALAEALKAL